MNEPSQNSRYVEPKNDRFWFGYLGQSQSGSIVLWDHRSVDAGENQVHLFHYKRREIVLFQKDLVRSKIRLLEEEEYVVLDHVVSCYFTTLAELAKGKHEAKERHEAVDLKSPEEIYRNSLTRECDHCDGDGFQSGVFGSFACRVCLGWGKIC